MGLFTEPLMARLSRKTWTTCVLALPIRAPTQGTLYCNHLVPQATEAVGGGQSRKKIDLLQQLDVLQGLAKVPGKKFKISFNYR